MLLRSQPERRQVERKVEPRRERDRVANGGTARYGVGDGSTGGGGSPSAVASVHMSETLDRLITMAPSVRRGSCSPIVVTPISDAQTGLSAMKSMRGRVW